MPDTVVDLRAEVIADIEGGATMIPIAALKNDPRFHGPRGVPHVATLYRIGAKIGAVRGPRGQLVTTGPAIERYVRRINGLPAPVPGCSSKQREIMRRQARAVLANARV